MKLIIAERDVDCHFRAKGALVLEQYTNMPDEDILEKAKQLASSRECGRIWTVDVDFDDAIEVERETAELEVEYLPDLIKQVSEGSGIDYEIISKCLTNGEALPFRLTQKIPF